MAIASSIVVQKKSFSRGARSGMVCMLHGGGSTWRAWTAHQEVMAICTRAVSCAFSTATYFHWCSAVLVLTDSSMEGASTSASWLHPTHVHLRSAFCRFAQEHKNGKLKCLDLFGLQCATQAILGRQLGNVRLLFPNILFESGWLQCLNWLGPAGMQSSDH